MLGHAKERWQEDLFVSVPLREMVPDDHILRRVDAVLDLSWLRLEVKPLYDATTGRPSVDPEVAVRLMPGGG
jgi:transposase